MRNMIGVLLLSLFCSSCVTGVVVGGLAGAGAAGACLHYKFWPCDEEKPKAEVKK